MTIKLNAEIRANVGKGASRASRNNKKIPAVIYGEKIAPTAINIDAHEFEMLNRVPGMRAKLFEITAGDKTESAMMVDIQYHRVSDKVMHIDFKRIDTTKPVSAKVPFEIINAELSRGLKFGGIVSYPSRHVVLIGKIADMPHAIQIDVQNVKIGDVIYGRDLTLPAGARLGLRQADKPMIAIGGKEKKEVVVDPNATDAKGKKGKK